jgi:hypothetical protein
VRGDVGGFDMSGSSDLARLAQALIMSCGTAAPASQSLPATVCRSSVTSTPIGPTSPSCENLAYSPLKKNAHGPVARARHRDSEPTAHWLDGFEVPKQHNRPTTIEEVFEFNDAELVDKQADPLETNNLANSGKSIASSSWP